MRIKFFTKRRPCTLVLKIKAKDRCVVHLDAIHGDIKNTFLSRKDRLMEKGEVLEFKILTPVSGWYTFVNVYQDGDFTDSSLIEVLSMSKKSLASQLNVVSMRNSDIRSFVDLAIRFSTHASILPVNTYISDNEKFKIKYLESIVENGEEQLTPARIEINTGVIEISKKRFVEMTVPERVCILTHEFSHLWLNEDMNDELEADLNGLILYLGLGFPRSDAFETFLRVFDKSPTEENQKRYVGIQNFIREYEKINYKTFNF